MKYLSVCSGIEAATVAWHPLGWEPVAFSEIDAFPSAVLQRHYPSVPNWGDMTAFKDWPDATFDLLVGGTPCQSFSVAGLRNGLDDPRGNLLLVYLALARRYRPRWLVWENVPGVLSSDDGRAFGSLLGGLAELGYGFAYRILDAQHFGLAQRRQRVFVVGCLGDWRRAAAVLFERESLSGHPAPRREAGQGVASSLRTRAPGSGGHGTDFDCDGGLIGSRWPAEIAPTLNAQFGSKQGLEDQHALGGAGLFVPAIYATDGQTNAAFASDLALTLNATNEQPYIAHSVETYSTPAIGDIRRDDIASTISRNSGGGGETQNPAFVLAHSLSADGFDASEETYVGTVEHETLYNQGINHASTPETHASALLRTLREEVGTEAFTQWGLGILDSLLPAEVLRQALHGRGVRLATFSRRWLVSHALAREDAHAEGLLLAMREAEREGRASQGWQPPKQLARELGAYLSELSQPGPQASRFMRDLWQAAEGAGLLREALSAVQAMGRSTRRQTEPAHSGLAVRRLTPTECEFLQGFPRGYLDIRYRGKPAADGPKYKALGNSMAVPVMAWIGRRIQMVESLEQSEVA